MLNAILRKGVTFTDTLPREMTATAVTFTGVDCIASPTQNGVSVSVTNGSIAPRGVCTFTVTLSLVAFGQTYNQFDVRSNEVPTATSNNAFLQIDALNK